MKSNIDQIELLISKYLSGNILPEEKETLLKWVDASSVNKKIFGQSKKIWENASHNFSLSDKKIDREKVKDEIIRQISRINTRNKVIRRFFRAAAVVALPLMLALGWNLRSEYIESNLSLCEVIAPPGHISKCTLPDGTNVWLNAGTSIEYNPVFKGKVREVKLSGQAYFNVVENKQKPFIVNTSNANIKVLGTSFDVKAYDEEDLFEAVLEKGLIELHVKNNNKTTRVVPIHPGERVQLNKIDGELSINEVDVSVYTAWKAGRYIFKDADLKTIVNALEELYDVTIHIENDSIGKMRYRGMFEYNNNILDALEAIERSANIKYHIKGREVWLE